MCAGARDRGGRPRDGRFQHAVKGETQDRQDAVARGEPMLDTPLGKVVYHEDGLY